jgi:putative DNA primase/helicase
MLAKAEAQPFAATGAEESARRHPRFLNDVESLTMPDVEWLLGRVLPLRNIAFLVAAAGSGKSFVAIDMAFSVVTGGPWLGRPVKQGPVVYVEAEGDPEWKYRLLAWKREHEVDKQLCGVEFLYEAVDLTDPKRIDQFVADVRALPQPPVLVVIDTLACCLGDGDENSATDMRVAIESMKRLRREFGCSVLATHHTGHANQDRARGSSAFVGGADTILSVAVTKGANLKWLAGYCGTSIEMIEKHYAKWLGADDDQLALLESGTRTRRTAGRKSAT